MTSLLLLLLSFSCCCSSVGSSREVLIQHAVQQLLGVPVGSPTGSPPPPPYMLELYRRYQSGDLRGTHQSNTVRSIVATRGTLKGDDVLLFNLSGIHDSEEILHAELHFFRRHHHRARKQRSASPPSPSSSPSHHHHQPRRLRVQLLSVDDGHPPHQLTSVDVAPPSRGWHASDVTSGVTGVRTRGGMLMAARFETTGKKGHHFRPFPARKLVAPQQPFLIVFSNDSVALFQDELEDEDEDEEDEEDVANATSALLMMARGRQRRDVAAAAAASPKRRSIAGDSNVIDEGDFGLRSNELPESGLDRRFNRVPVSHPGVLLPRTKPSGRRAKKPQHHHHRGFLPLPPRANKQRHQQPREPQRTIKWRQDKLENEALPEEDDYDNDAPCRRRKLVVEFADIGWGEWIISPKAFDAHFCAGSCPFPLTKNVRPSNHATIQSLVHAVGGRVQVPPPCCVPDAMTSVTLLYFDEDRNVVLKNYPSMTVESCACR